MVAQGTLNVSLTPELEKIIRERVATGHYQTPNDVIREGLRLLEERDRQMSVGPAVIMSPDSGAPIADRFRELADEWRANRPKGGDIADLVMHPAYQKIIGMGTSALPYLLADLARKPDHWFWALYAITRENPVPPESEGNLKQMAEAWIRWGRERGHIGELD